MNTDTRYTEWLFNLVPGSFQKGYAGATTFVRGTMMDTLAILLNDALEFRFVKSPLSPDDVLGELGKECGIPRYSGETAAQHRQRIIDRWATQPRYGTEPGMVLGFNQSGFSSVQIKTQLLGSNLPIPSVSGNPALDIPAYPRSADHYSQFAVLIDLTADEADGPGTESTLITDERMNAIRQLISFLKPVDWVCRMIILRRTGSGTPVFYDDGTTYDSGAQWGPLPGTSVVVERHRAVR